LVALIFLLSTGYAYADVIDACAAYNCIKRPLPNGTYGTKCREITYLLDEEDGIDGVDGARTGIWLD
jgi:hypothetical protein